MNVEQLVCFTLLVLRMDLKVSFSPQLECGFLLNGSLPGEQSRKWWEKYRAINPHGGLQTSWVKECLCVCLSVCGGVCPVIIR